MSNKYKQQIIREHKYKKSRNKNKIASRYIQAAYEHSKDILNENDSLNNFIKCLYDVGHKFIIIRPVDSKDFYLRDESRGINLDRFCFYINTIVGNDGEKLRSLYLNYTLPETIPEYQKDALKDAMTYRTGLLIHEEDLAEISKKEEEYNEIIKFIDKHY